MCLKLSVHFDDFKHNNMTGELREFDILWQGVVKIRFPAHMYWAEQNDTLFNLV